MILTLLFCLISQCQGYSNSQVQLAITTSPILQRNQIPMLSDRQEQAAVQELETVKNRADLIRLNGQQVKLVGRYVSSSSSPPPESTGIPGFKGLYIRANIVLEDGTQVAIFPPYNKQSLRSPTEAKKYNQKLVEATGKVEISTDQRLNPDRQSHLWLETLKLHSQVSK